MSEETEALSGTANRFLKQLIDTSARARTGVPVSFFVVTPEQYAAATIDENAFYLVSPAEVATDLTLPTPAARWHGCSLRVINWNATGTPRIATCHHNGTAYEWVLT